MGILQRLVKVLEGYARRSFPYSFHLLIVFGAIFAISMLSGGRQPASVVAMCVTLLLAFFAVLLPNRRIFALSTDARRLMKFMGLKSRERRIGFCVTVFKNTLAEDLRSDSFTYFSLPRDDVYAMIELVAELGKHDLLKEEEEAWNLLVDASEQNEQRRFDTLVYIGGPRVSSSVGTLVENDPVVSYEHAGEGKPIAVIVARGLNRRYMIRPPSPDTKRTTEDTMKEDTYGCVMKRVDSKPTCFAIWGLDARGTLAAARWVTSYWREFKKLYGIGFEESFTAVLRVPANHYAASKPERVAYDGMPLLLPREVQQPRSSLASRPLGRRPLQDLAR